MSSVKGNKCMFFNCGKSKRTHNIKLFRFPKDENRAKEWVKQSGKLVDKYNYFNNSNINKVLKS